jgi:hypothetical protein
MNPDGIMIGLSINQMLNVYRSSCEHVAKHWIKTCKPVKLDLYVLSRPYMSPQAESYSISSWVQNHISQDFYLYVVGLVNH